MFIKNLLRALSTVCHQKITHYERSSERSLSNHCTGTDNLKQRKKIIHAYYTQKNEQKNLP